MKVRSFLYLFVGALFFSPWLAVHAGGADSPCGPNFALHGVAGYCGSYGVPFISPANRRSNNVQLYWAERRGFELTVVENGEGGENWSPYYGQERALVRFRQHSGRWVGDGRESRSRQKERIRELVERLRADKDSLSAVEQSGWASGLCRQNDLGSVLSFLEALNADRDKGGIQDVAGLAEARIALFNRCEEDVLGDPVLLVGSPALAPYSVYLRAIAAFYSGDFEQAGRIFKSLVNTADGWVGETSEYMMIRVKLREANLQAQDGSSWRFDREAIDPAYPLAAKAYIDQYLENYPDGEYAESAYGLYERVYWMLEDGPALGRALVASLDRAEPEQIPRLALDLSRYYFSPYGKEPEVLSPEIAMLRSVSPRFNRDRPRDMEDEEWFDKVFGPFGEEAATYRTVAELARELFRGRSRGRQPREVDFDQVIERTPALDPEAELSLVDYTLQVYRGIALKRGGYYKEAESHWKALMNRDDDPSRLHLAELGLARTYFLAGDLEKVFAHDSPIQDSHYRIRALAVSASAAHLKQHLQDTRMPMTERQSAATRLLTQLFLRGRYSEFLEAIQLVEGFDELDGLSDDMKPGSYRLYPDSNYPCPSLHSLAEKLAEGDRSPSVLNCKGEKLIALRQTGRSHSEWRNPRGPDTGPSQFEGVAKSPLSQYMRVIEEAGSDSDDRAFALYRAINCYHRGQNRCGSQRVPEDTRARWFWLLKNRHGDTEWAKAQEYYW